MASTVREGEPADQTPQLIPQIQVLPLALHLSPRFISDKGSPSPVWSGEGGAGPSAMGFRMAGRTGSPSSRRVRIHVSGWRLPRRARHLEQGAKVLGHREMLSEDYRLSLERVMRVLDFLSTNIIILINVVILGKVMQCYH